MKKIILLNGSPRTHGNTYQSLEMIQNIFKENEIDSEIIQLGSMNIFGCKACNGCYKNKNNKCSIDNDGLNEVINKVFNADGLIIGSPTYYSNVTGNVKNFIDRCGYVNNANGNYLKGKPGAPIVSVRRSGGNFTYAAINFFFGINEMPIITSSY
jgi:multimeric flavodoxin WrbA